MAQSPGTMWSRVRAWTTVPDHALVSGQLTSQRPPSAVGVESSAEGPGQHYGDHSYSVTGVIRAPLSLVFPVCKRGVRLLSARV